MATFQEKLTNAANKNNSLLCVGLDPDKALMPQIDVATFTTKIIDATSDLVCCYKPNLAFFEALGNEGLDALTKVVALAHAKGIPVIGDSKREDIGNSSRFYASRLFDMLGLDAVTVNPYMGSDSVGPFLEYKDKGVLVLCRTSNPGAADFQEQTVLVKGTKMPLFELVARTTVKWNRNGNIGLVAGATDPKAIGEIRKICQDMPILIPGVGAQAGDLETSIRFGVDSLGGGLMLNSSRQTIYASKGNDFAEASRKVAVDLRDKINAARLPALKK
ncbi:MAG: orotidine-5'-phosphate decarboxylase [Dehalococcoidia bacterium]|nr:orotidine-5'-phosphate decarboxylase [Dehalococcoidia bacterium]